MKIIRERQVIEGISHDLCFDWIGDDGQPDGGGFSFTCDENGQVDTDGLQATARENYDLCVSGQMLSRDGRRVGAPYVRSWPYRHVEPAVAECENCGGEATMARGCGAWVCGGCEHHQGLCRCYCGWSVSGNDGCEELAEMGETIDSLD